MKIDEKFLSVFHDSATHKYESELNESVESYRRPLDIIVKKAMLHETNSSYFSSSRETPL